MSASPEFSVKVSTTAEDKAECQRVRIEGKCVATEQLWYPAFDCC